MIKMAKISIKIMRRMNSLMESPQTHATQKTDPKMKKNPVKTKARQVA